MVIHHDAESALSRIDNYFKPNNCSIDYPDIYLEAKLNKMIRKNGVWAWKKSPARYVKELVANVDKYLAELSGASWKFPKKKDKNTFVGDYAPDMEDNPYL